MDNYELIDKYVRGEMSSTEQHLFQEKMSNDSELQKSVAIRLALVKAIQISAEEDLKQKLKELDATIDKKSNSYRYYFKLAASVIVVLALVFYFFSIATTKETSIAEYDLVDIGLPNKMGNSEQLSLVEGMNYFKQKDYANALITFKRDSHELVSDTVAYYTGICYFRLDSATQAIKMFLQVTSMERSAYKLKAEYRLGLCYWKKGELKNAKESFKKVSNAELTDYSTVARRILKRNF